MALKPEQVQQQMCSVEIDSKFRQKAIDQLTSWSKQDPQIIVSEQNILLWCTASIMTQRVGKKTFQNFASSVSKSVAIGKGLWMQHRSEQPILPQSVSSFWWSSCGERFQIGQQAWIPTHGGC